MCRDLPTSPELPIPCLASSFRDVTNSYKFYWFLAILESIGEGQGSVIPLSTLLSEMVASVWYPTNYFRLSFGKQDRLGELALELGESSGLPMDAVKEKVKEIVQWNLESRTSIGRKLRTLGDYVPYRFLRPFFSSELRGLPDSQINGKVIALAGEGFHSEHPCLYRFVRSPQESIELHPAWVPYLTKNWVILQDFCFWNLVKYLQRNNPNVPNLAAKLFEPKQRNLANAREFWRTAMEELGRLTCVYSGEELSRRNFSLDHFLPWRFVTHDLLWNIVPTSRSVNAAKSDNLPDLERYFERFAQTQYRAFQVVSSRKHEKLLEDYLLLFRAADIAQIRSYSEEKFQEVLYREIAPQVQIARNMGFDTWRFGA